MDLISSALLPFAVWKIPTHPSIPLHSWHWHQGWSISSTIQRLLNNWNGQEFHRFDVQIPEIEHHFANSMLQDCCVKYVSVFEQLKATTVSQIRCFRIGVCSTFGDSSRFSTIPNMKSTTVSQIRCFRIGVGSVFGDSFRFLTIPSMKSTTVSQIRCFRIGV